MLKFLTVNSDSHYTVEIKQSLDMREGIGFFILISHTQSLYEPVLEQIMLRCVLESVADVKGYYAELCVHSKMGQLTSRLFSAADCGF